MRFSQSSTSRLVLLVVIVILSRMKYPCRFIIWDSLLLLIISSVVLFSSRVQGQCTGNRFQCDNAKCIPMNWQCDGEDDCGDGSDESICEERTCSAIEFECHSGDQCIPVRWRCDGDPDCDDGSDEAPEGCAGNTCSDFSCGDEESPCIPHTWVCDQELDCDSGLDEANCNLLTCTPDEFKCKDNSQCISTRWVCDHDPDCNDQSDESDCTDVTCAPDYSMCNSSLNCIPDGWLCDGDTDCSDGSDEGTCETPPSIEQCGPGLFMCGNGYCIHEGWQCDHEDDCGDNTDENYVTCPVPTCQPHQHSCKSGDCIVGEACDGYNDCEDGSDEEDCPTTPGLPVEHTSPTPVHPPANQCGTGYRITDAGCVEVDECLDRVHPVCSHICINTEGSFRCHCQEGFQLENNSHCKASGASPWIVYVYYNAIRKYHMATRENVNIYADQKQPLAVEVDIKEGYVFWSDSKDGKIMMGNIDGTMEPRTVVDNVGVLDGIAYDWIHGNIYWTDYYTSTINVASVDSGNRVVLFTEDANSEPRSIVVDPHNGYIYWTDWGTEPKVVKAAMDGSSREVIFHQGKTSIQWPNGLAIDYTQDRLYWVDGKHHILMSSDLAGGSFHVVLKDELVFRHPFQLAVFEDRVYWTDWETDSIRSANKFTGGQVTDVIQQLTLPKGLLILQETKQPAGENYCDTALARRCTHLSVANPLQEHSRKSSRCSCLCPEGMNLLADGATCNGSEPIIAYEPSAVPKVDPIDGGDHDGDIDNHIRTDNDTLKDAPKMASSLIWIIILAVVIIVIITVVMVLFIAKKKSASGKRSMNFDNPVYRKTTEDQLFLSTGGTGTTYEHNKGNSTSSFTPMIQTDDVI